MDKANEKLKREKVFSSSTIKISNALSDLEDADPDILKKLSEEMRRDVLATLRRIEERCAELSEAVGGDLD